MNLREVAALVCIGRLDGEKSESSELARFEDTINPQQGGVNLPVETAVPALPFVVALLLAAGLGVMGLRKARLRPGAVFAGLLCWAAFGAPASGQGIGLAALAGTTGVGPEISFRTGSVVIRGAYGRLPVTIDATRWFDFEGVERVGVELPRNWFTVGADLAMGRVFRVGGGVLYKPDDFKADVTFGADTVAIGGRSYSLADIATLEGGWSNRTAAPFVLVGFGSQASAGFGVSVDVGVAFAGDAALNLSAQGHAAVIDTDEFRDALDRAERQVEDLTGRYLKYWPVVNVRLRFGVG